MMLLLVLSPKYEESAYASNVTKPKILFFQLQTRIKWKSEAKSLTLYT
jgi:hypothetical protein